MNGGGDEMNASTGWVTMDSEGTWNRNYPKMGTPILIEKNVKGWFGREAPKRYMGFMREGIQDKGINLGELKQTIIELPFKMKVISDQEPFLLDQQGTLQQQGDATGGGGGRKPKYSKKRKSKKSKSKRRMKRSKVRTCKKKD